MWNDYFVNEDIDDIYEIPEEYHTQEMWDEQFDKDYILLDVPEKFLTQEMVNKFYHESLEDIDCHDIDFYFTILNNIPKKFITKDIITNLIKLIFEKHEISLYISDEIIEQIDFKSLFYL